jgi:hypothetical protein
LKPDSVAVTAAGFIPNQVIANIAELLFHPAGTGIADGDNANERPNAHDDSQHGQKTANPITNQRL